MEAAFRRPEGQPSLREAHTNRTVGESENAQHVDLDVGDTLAFRLTENASTGYRWQVVAIEPPLLEVDEKRVAAPGASPGAAAEIVISLTARSRGDGRVTVGLRRGWEVDAAPARSLKVSVSVR